jgi:uncharacterized damage-inducible protein DinB
MSREVQLAEVAMSERSKHLIVMPSEVLLEHWQGHRRVTRRVIQAFPDDALVRFSVGGMRPFSALAWELVSMAAGGIQGLATRKWPTERELLHHANRVAPDTRAELLRIWDEVTEQIDTLWPQIPAGRFEEVDNVFGQYEGPVYGSFLYWIDNEVHHRGQGYVYLRALGIEPPAFYDRS